MQAFGVTLDRYNVPVFFLAFSVLGYFLIRESVHMFQHPVSMRAITILINCVFVLLTLPSIRSQKYLYYSKTVLYLILFWLAWAAFVTLIGDQPWPAMMRWVEILTNFLMAFCLYQLLQHKPDLYKPLLYAIMGTTMFCLAVFLFYWFILATPIKHDWSSEIPLFINIRHFGHLMAISLPLAYWWLEQHKRSQFSPIIYLTLCWALVFWLGGRGTFIGVMAATLIFLYKRPNFRLQVLLAAFSGLLLSQFFTTDHPSLNLFRLLDLFWQDGPVDMQALTSFRTVIYEQSIAYWWQTAPISGIGADGYRYISPAIGGVEAIAHPHSITIQLLLSYGIPGLVIPIWLATSFLNNQRRLRHPVQVLALPILSMALLAQVDGSLYHAQGLFITCIVLGIGASLFTVKQKAEQKTMHLMVAVVSICLIYWLIFSLQLYVSRNKCMSQGWINWNIKYPIYLSATWTYESNHKHDNESMREQLIKLKSCKNAEIQDASN
jgi:hypothetical protein